MSQDRNRQSNYTHMSSVGDGLDVLELLNEVQAQQAQRNSDTGQQQQQEREEQRSDDRDGKHDGLAQSVQSDTAIRATAEAAEVALRNAPDLQSTQSGGVQTTTDKELHMRPSQTFPSFASSASSTDQQADDAPQPHSQNLRGRATKRHHDSNKQSLKEKAGSALLLTAPANVSAVVRSSKDAKAASGMTLHQERHRAFQGQYHGQPQRVETDEELLMQSSDHSSTFDELQYVSPSAASMTASEEAKMRREKTMESLPTANLNLNGNGNDNDNSRTNAGRTMSQVTVDTAMMAAHNVPGLNRVEGETAAAARAAFLRPGAVRIAGYTATSASDDDDEASNAAGPTEDITAPEHMFHPSAGLVDEEEATRQLFEATLVVDDGDGQANAETARRMRELEDRTRRLEDERTRMLRQNPDLINQLSGLVEIDAERERQLTEHHPSHDDINGAATNDDAQNIHGDKARQHMIMNAEPLRETPKICGISRTVFLVRLVAIIIVAVVVILSVTLGGDGGSSFNASIAATAMTMAPTTLSPSSAPSSSPTEEFQPLYTRRFNELVTILYPDISDLESLTIQDPQSSQNKALWWLARDDPAELEFASMNTQRLRERYLMAMVWFQHGGPDWYAKANWMSDADVCQWLGVGCDGENNTIATIGGTENNFQNNVFTEIGQFRDLQYLNMAYNDLTGEIPSEIGMLTKLTSLIINGCILTGTLPSEIGLLTSLYTLSLDFNGLVGSLPSEINNLVLIDDLSLVGTELTGDLTPLLCNPQDITEPLAVGDYNTQCLNDNPSIRCDCCNTCCSFSECCTKRQKNGYKCYALTEYDC